MTLPDIIINNINQATLKSYIESRKEIGENNQFSLRASENSRPKHLEVKSTVVNYSNQLQIVYTLKNLTDLFELNEMKSKEKYSSMFVSSISHEFRTQINIISGNIEIIELNENIGSYHRLSLDSIKKANLYLEVIVQDLIDFSRIKENQLNINLHPFSITKIVKEALSLLEAKFKDKNIRIILEMNIDPEFIINSDSMRIKQILVNFLSNAWKFTIQGEVSITVNFDGETDFIIFSVSDSGIGISQEDIPKLMKPFSKLEDKNHLNDNGIII